jgi:hypothetical protein
MAATSRDALYALLPAIHRVRDAEQGQPLRALLRVVRTEFDRLDADIAQLYDNWFIETCDEWVVPYIGDLLRVRPIHPVDAARVTTRAYVANTLAYRRRKGTAVVLEQLARDTTGWPARAVEFFTRLITTPHMNHVRLAPPAAPEIRDAAAAELTGSAFDRFGHTLEVRRLASGRGRYNIPNVGLFLWRLQAYPAGRPDEQGLPTDFVTAREVADDAAPGRVFYTVHPAGVDSPLFNEPQTEDTITHLAEEENVPDPLRRLVLEAELDAIRRAAATSPPSTPDGLRFMTASTPAFRVFVERAPGGPRVEVPREQIYLCDIPDDIANLSPPIDAIAIDPERGRLAFPGGEPRQRVLVTSSYGFPGDLGGGPYDRSDAIEAVANPDWQLGVSHLQAPVANELVGSLREAVIAWNLLPPGQTGVISILDSLTERDAVDPAVLFIRVPARSRLLIVGADWPEPRTRGRFDPVDVRPHYIGDLIVGGESGSGDRGQISINGLLLEGSLIIEPGALGALTLSHSTIVPHRGELLVEGGNDDLRLTIERSITGAIRLHAAITQLSLRDCLVLGQDEGSPALAIEAPDTQVTIDQTTIFGETHVQTLDASNTIFDAPAIARRRQQGCVRFSYVPPGSHTPRRHRCQPDTAIAAASDAASGAASGAADVEVVRRRVIPTFNSRRYGDPELGQLRLQCAPEIRQGADNGSEMGAWCFLQQPQREANLRAVLDEYLRFGLEAGLFYVTVPRRRTSV